MLRVRWVPAHTTAASVHDGRIAAVDRAGNRVADELVGQAALLHPSTAQQVVARQRAAVGVGTATRWLADLAQGTLEGKITSDCPPRRPGSLAERGPLGSAATARGAATAAPPRPHLPAWRHVSAQ